MPYTRILVTVDGSETSAQALTEAAKLAHALHAKLHIIHIVTASPKHHAAATMDLHTYQQFANREGLALLEKSKQSVQTITESAETQLIEMNCSMQSIAEKIIAAAQAWKADLIVIGTHGRRGLKRFVLGSAAEETLRIAHIPILLIRCE